MTRFIRISALTAGLVLLLLTTAAADLTVKTKTTMSGIMGMGNIDMEQTYLVAKDKIATQMQINNPLLGVAGGITTRMILRDNGKEMVVINYHDSSYSVHKTDSIQIKIDAEMEKALDSLKQMLTIEKMEARLTGKKKPVQGFNAEEMSMLIKMKMHVPMMGEQPTPINFSMQGTQWLTQDFAEAAFYKSLSNNVINMMMSSSGSGLNALMPMLEKLGIDKKTADEMTKMAGFIPLEGEINMVIQMEMPAMEGELKEEADTSLPGMTMNMNMKTTLLSASKAAIPAGEFEAPQGFKKVEDAGLNFGSKAFPFPGM